MKTISITIDEDLDAQVTAEAARRGTSKSEIIRRAVRDVLPKTDQPTQRTGNLLVDLAGTGDPDLDLEGVHHNEILYGT